MNNLSPDSLINLRDKLRTFVGDRDWGQFHTPKNLATALSVEAAELLEPFQWLATGEVSELTSAKQTAIRAELADVLLYLVLLADKLEVDLLQAANEKIEQNGIKYPAEKVRGDARKYTEY